MSILARLEATLTRLLEDGLGGLLGAKLEPVEIAHRLADYMVDHRTIAAGRRYVPNVYRVYVAPRTLERFAGFRGKLQEELAAYVQERARENQVRMVGRAHVELLADPSLKTGRLRIEADLVEAGPAEPAQPQLTQPMAVDRTEMPGPAPLALLVGQRRFVLRGHRPMAIGRALDNDVVIDHPSVSRHHARICAHGTGWLLEDLGSSNGSYVNNGRVTSKYVRRGDSIRVGSVTMLLDEPAEEESR